MKEFVDYMSDGFVKCKMIQDEEKFDIEAIYVNKQLESITNKTSEELIGKRMTEVFPTLKDSIFDWPKILCEAAMTSEHTVIEQYINAFEKFVEINIFGYNKGIFYMIFMDITHKREIRRILLEKDRQIQHLEREVKSRANIEPLTNLYNFQFVTDCIKHSIESYKEDGTEFCLFLVDIDDFKKFNLKYGIDIGDRILQDVAQILSLSARKIDVVGRYGNDQFIMVLNNIDLDIAKVIIERIKMDINRHNLGIGKTEIYISGGLVEYRGESLEEFIKKGEEILEKAQAMDKGTILS